MCITNMRESSPRMEDIDDNDAWSFDNEDLMLVEAVSKMEPTGRQQRSGLNAIWWPRWGP
jgi:hypothetical protein